MCEVFLKVLKQNAGRKFLSTASLWYDFRPEPNFSISCCQNIFFAKLKASLRDSQLIYFIRSSEINVYQKNG